MPDIVRALTVYENQLVFIDRHFVVYVDSRMAEAYGKWYEKQWADCVNLPKLAENTQFPFLKDWVDKFHYRFSSIWRHECLFNMRYFAQIRKTEYDVVVCKVFRRITSDDKEPAFKTNYAFIYIYENEPEYVCLAGTYKSMDGEYRYRWITYEQFDRMHKRYAEGVAMVEAYLKTLFKEGRLALSSDVLVHDNNVKTRKACDKLVEKLNLIHRLFVICWYIDCKRLSRLRLENHLTPGYSMAMFSKQDIEFIRDSDIKIDAIKFVRYYKSEQQNLSVLSLGQKIIPLTVKEVEQSTDIQFGPWREMHAASLVGKLVINGVGGMFPILNDWFFLLHGSESLYDNDVQHIRLQHSEIAEDVVRSLEQVRRKTYKPDGVTKKEVYLSLRMEELGEAIEIPIEFAESEVVLSDVTLISSVEHLGATFGDLINLLSDDVVSGNHGPLFADFTVFNRYLFDLIYGIWCINNRMNMIHSDLHRNNMTTYIKNTLLKTENTYILPSAQLLFSVQETLYMFPHFGSHAAIIDFSRAIFGRQHVIENFPEHQVHNILGDQKVRILGTIRRELPDFYKTHSKELEQSLAIAYDQVFKLFQAIDLLKIANGWIVMVKSVLDNPKHLKSFGDKQMLTKQAIPLLEKIRDLSLGFLTADIPRIWEQKLRAEDLPQPALEVIKSCFNEFKLENWKGDVKTVNLVDYFNDSNPLTYDPNDADKLPPTMDLEYIKKHKVPGEINAVYRYEDYQPYLDTHPVEEEIQSVIDAEKATKAERRGLPEELDPSIPAAKPKKTDIPMTDSLYMET